MVFLFLNQNRSKIEYHNKKFLIVSLTKGTLSSLSIAHLFESLQGRSHNSCQQPTGVDFSIEFFLLSIIILNSVLLSSYHGNNLHCW